MVPDVGGEGVSADIASESIWMVHSPENNPNPTKTVRFIFIFLCFRDGEKRGKEARVQFLMPQRKLKLAQYAY